MQPNNILRVDALNGLVAWNLEYRGSSSRRQSETAAMKLAAIGAASLAFLAAVPASGAIITRDFVLDLNAGTRTDGRLEFTLPSAPFTINQGDSLGGDVTFARGERATISDPTGTAVEGVGIVFTTDNPDSFSDMRAQLIEEQGGPGLAIASGFPSPFELRSVFVRDFTDTSFSFAGFRYFFNVINVGATVDPSSFFIEGAEIRGPAGPGPEPVPEPLVGGLLGLGVFSIGALRRRRLH